jgi:Na+/proline symporter
MLTELAIVTGYLLLTLVIGVAAFRVTDHGAVSYYLADRSLGTVVLVFTTFATLLSAFTFFGGPNLTFAAGPEWILVMGVMDGVLFAILWYVMGYRQWQLGQREGYVTIGELLGDQLGSVTLRRLIAAVSIGWLFPYVMLQQMGAGEAIVGLTGGGVPYWVGAFGITVFMIAYVAVAGMRGVAWTDTLQGIVMLGVVWIAVAVVAQAAGGLGALGLQMEMETPGFLALGGGVYTPQWMIGTAVTIAFGVTMFPQINQRFFVARDVRTLKRSFIIWPLMVVLLFVPAFMFGAWGAALGVPVPEGANVVAVVLSAVAPGWFVAVVIAGALAAMMSSSDSMLLSGASYFTRDLVATVRADAFDRLDEAWVGRLGVMVFALAAFGGSLLRPGTLITIGDTAFGGFAQLTVPVLIALYWRGTSARAVIAAVVITQLAYLAHVFIDPVTVGMVSVFTPTYLGWDFALYGMVAGALITVIGSLADPAAEPTDRGERSVL